MKKAILLTLIAGLGTGIVSAESFSLFKRKGKSPVRHEAMAQKKSIGDRINYLDQTVEYSEYLDKKYRYVFTYNSAGERATETVYVSVKTDGVWSEEKVETRGKYSYEYDTRKRVAAKEVNYSPETDRFISYRIEVAYSGDCATYTRYEYLSPSDKEWREESRWKYDNDGNLLSFKDLGSYKSYGINMRPDGSVESWNSDDNSEPVYTVTGSLNDSTLTVKYPAESSYNDSYTKYRYNSHGRPELIEGISNYDSYREEFKYDTFGRIVSELYYGEEDDWDGGPSTRASDIAWTVEETISYEYATDEVYPLNHPMRVMFGFHGPLKKVVSEWEGVARTTTFTYDANGVLTAVDYKDDDTYEPTQMVFTVNNGHIEKYTETWDSSTSTYSYVWEGDKCVSRTEEYGYGPYVTNVSYQDNGFTMTDKDPDSRIITTESITFDENGFRYIFNGDGVSSSRTQYFVNEVQQRDVRFTMPNLLNDISGMTPEMPVIVSVAGRVVTAYDKGGPYDRYGANGYGGNGPESFIWDEEWYNNIGCDYYYSVKEDSDGRIVCSSIKGLPVYVLDSDQRLVAKYSYYEEVLVGPASETRSVEVPKGNSYILTEYLYGEDGRILGMTMTDVSEDGEVLGSVEVENQWNEEYSAIETVVSAGQGIRLDGRYLSLADGTVFSVYDVNGLCEAENVESHVFAKAGVYVIRTTEGTVKVNIH